MATIDYKEKYEQAMERARQFFEKPYLEDSAGIVRHIFPELKESEDERIRKDLITFLDDIWHLGKNANFDKWSKADCYDWLAWLEKQSKDSPVLSNSSNIGKVEQKPAFEMKTPEESLGIDSDTYNKVVDECVYGEQKPVKVPKFKVGDFIQFNGMGHTRYTIKEVCGLSHYINTCNKSMDMSYTDANFELVEQKPWSEEDGEMFDAIISDIQFTQKAHNHEVNQVVYEREIDWLKSFKDRYTWKPSDEQMEYLAKAITTLGDEGNCKTASILNDLRVELKKLRG